MRTLKILDPKLAEAIKATEIPPPIGDPILRAAAIRARIRLDESAIAEFCRTHGITKLALFGSILREDFREDSDVDVLVEFDPQRTLSLFELAGIEADLETLRGRKVDMGTRGELRPRILQHVIDTSEVIYAGA